MNRRAFMQRTTAALAMLGESYAIHTNRPQPHEQNIQLTDKPWPWVHGSIMTWRPRSDGKPGLEFLVKRKPKEAWREKFE